MTGSTIIAEFPSRRELDQWLAQDPYVTQEVWNDIQVIPCRIAPPFVK